MVIDTSAIVAMLLRWTKTKPRSPGSRGDDSGKAGIRRAALWRLPCLCSREDTPVAAAVSGRRFLANRYRQCAADTSGNRSDVINP
jgi:hypothetical protein